MASGDTLEYATASSNEPPATGYATPFIRNGVAVLEFNDTVDNSSEYGFVMPAYYSGGGITVTVGWVAASATTGTVSIDVSLKSITDAVDNIDTKTFAAANNGNFSAPVTSGITDYAEIAFADGAEMDSVAAGEYFRLKVDRDADSTTSTDNMAGNLQLVFILIKET